MAVWVWNLPFGYYSAKAELPRQNAQNGLLFDRYDYRSCWAASRWYHDTPSAVLVAVALESVFYQVLAPWRSHLYSCAGVRIEKDLLYDMSLSVRRILREA